MTTTTEILAQTRNNETIGSMAAQARMQNKGWTTGKRLPLRYHVALDLYNDNIDSHPEIATMTWGDARDLSL